MSGLEGIPQFGGAARELVRQLVRDIRLDIQTSGMSLPEGRRGAWRAHARQRTNNSVMPLLEVMNIVHGRTFDRGASNAPMGDRTPDFGIIYRRLEGLNHL